MRGYLEPAGSTETLRWRGEQFLSPFDFDYSAVTQARFPVPRKAPALQGEFAVELLCGDLLTGRIPAWDERSLTLDSVHFGQLTIRPEAVRRIYRLGENPTISFSGMSGLVDWKTNDRPWQEEGRQIETIADGAMATIDVDMPDTALIEFEVSWKGKPGFVLALGVDPEKDEDDRQDGWRFEIWGDDLTVVREQALQADVDRVQTLNPRIQKTHLYAYLNQATGSLNVFHAGGTPAGKITVPGDTPRKRGRGVRLINRHGTVPTGTTADRAMERDSTDRGRGRSGTLSDGGWEHAGGADHSDVAGREDRSSSGMRTRRRGCLRRT